MGGGEEELSGNYHQKLQQLEPGAHGWWECGQALHYSCTQIPSSHKQPMEPHLPSIPSLVAWYPIYYNRVPGPHGMWYLLCPQSLV